MAEGLPLGRTEVVAGIDEIVIHIVQDIENGQNHKRKLDVACDKDKWEIGKEQLLWTDSDKFQELVNGAILTKNSDKGISLSSRLIKLARWLAWARVDGVWDESKRGLLDSW